MRRALIRAVRKLGALRMAEKRVGIGRTTCWQWRREDAAFALEITLARRAFLAEQMEQEEGQMPMFATKRTPQLIDRFLVERRRHGSISLAGAAVGLAPATIKLWRRQLRAFDADVLATLAAFDAEHPGRPRRGRPPKVRHTPSQMST